MVTNYLLNGMILQVATPKAMLSFWKSVLLGVHRKQQSRTLSPCGLIISYLFTSSAKRQCKKFDQPSCTHILYILHVLSAITKREITRSHFKSISIYIYIVHFSHTNDTWLRVRCLKCPQGLLTQKIHQFVDSSEGHCLDLPGVLAGLARAVGSGAAEDFCFHFFGGKKTTCEKLMLGEATKSYRWFVCVDFVPFLWKGWLFLNFQWLVSGM